jgi:hypothetical protein
MLQSHLCNNLVISVDNVYIESIMFPKIPRKIISMIYVVLGKDNVLDNWLKLMDSWYGLLVVIDANYWRVIL